VLFIGGSLLTQKMDPPKPITDLYGRLLDMRNPLGIRLERESDK
jgi:hypothetical protein